MLDSFYPQVSKTFPQAGLRLLQRARGLTNTALGAFDTLNKWCWPSQTTPSTTDTWVNAIDGQAGASFGTGVGWDATNGGFVFGSATTDKVNLPTGNFVLAANEVRRVVMFGVRHDVQPTGTGGVGIFGAGNIAAELQYGLYANLASGGQGTISFMGPGSLSPIATAVVSPPASPTPYSFAIDIQLIASGPNAGKYQYDCYVNKVLVASVVTSATSLPGATAAFVGADAGTQSTWVGKLFACAADPVTDTVFDIDTGTTRTIYGSEVVARWHDANFGLWA